MIPYYELYVDSYDKDTYVKVSVYALGTAYEFYHLKNQAFVFEHPDFKATPLYFIDENNQEYPIDYPFDTEMNLYLVYEGYVKVLFTDLPEQTFGPVMIITFQEEKIATSYVQSFF